MYYARRLPVDLSPSPLQRLRAAAGDGLTDLTETNPSRCGFSWAPVSVQLCGPAVAYAPRAGGSAAARAAIVAHMAALGQALDADALVLTASTSEAYSMAFKLLCEPGDRIAMPSPGYPLLQHLAELEGVHTWPCPMHYEGRWRLDLESLAAACAGGCRAIVLVSPNNPTGSVLTDAEAAAVGALARRYGIAVLVDQVFAAYPQAGGPRWLQLDAPLWFTLDGLSKLAGLPQVKVGWLALHGDAEHVAAAHARLLWIADASLALSGPVQAALPDLLAAAPAVRAQIQARLRANLASLGRLVQQALPMVDLLAVEGGWHAVLRLPQEPDEEAVVAHLLTTAGAFVHPGYFYDFARRGHLVTGLLLPTETFTAAWTRVARALRVLWP